MLNVVVCKAGVIYKWLLTDRLIGGRAYHSFPIHSFIPCVIHEYLSEQTGINFGTLIVSLKYGAHSPQT